MRQTKAPHINDTKPIMAVRSFELPPAVFKNKGGDVLTCAVTPDLPTGLELSVEDNTIVLRGVPKHISPVTVYAITAGNDTGDCVTKLSITVIEAPIHEQRDAIIKENSVRGDLDTPRS